MKCPIDRKTKLSFDFRNKTNPEGRHETHRQINSRLDVRRGSNEL